MPGEFVVPERTATIAAMLIRGLLILLLALNLGVALWWALGTEPPAAAQAVLPPGVALLQLVAAEGVTTAASPSGTLVAERIEQCASFGAFPSGSAAEAAGQRLHSDGINDGGEARNVIVATVREIHVGKPRSWRVLLPALSSVEESHAVAKLIAATGFRDYYVIRDGVDANAIALGLFGNEKSANDRAATLVAAGFAAEAQPVGAGPVEHWLDIAADGRFDAERLREQLATKRTEPIDCEGFSARTATVNPDMEDNSAPR